MALRQNDQNIYRKAERATVLRRDFFPLQAAAEVFVLMAEDFHLWSMTPVTSEERTPSRLGQRGKSRFLIDFLEGCSGGSWVYIFV